MCVYFFFYESWCFFQQCFFQNMESRIPSCTLHLLSQICLVDEQSHEACRVDNSILFP